MKILWCLVCLSLTLFTIPCKAQSTDQQLASQYFQNGEFEKAILYYKKLYGSRPNDYYYGYLFKSYLQTEQYDQAEKLVKKQLRTSKGNVKYYVDLGQVYEATNQPSKSQKLFEKAIKDMEPNRNSVISLAKAFMAISENEFALETYVRGRKLLKGSYPFNTEIADIHGAMGNYQSMISEYLDLLEINASYIQTVQNALNRSMSFEKKTKQNQILKTELLKKIQKRPNNIVFSELLTWLYIQHKDFKAALIQSKAMDKRFKEDGGRIIALAKMCSTNESFDIAIEAYQYLLDKGKDSHYYVASRMELLSVLNRKITSNVNYTQADLNNLQSKYYETISELGKNQSTVPLLKELALLQAYYLHNLDTAIYNLELAINLPSLKPTVKAECKLVLGDLLLMSGEIWDASLLYGQVDRDFKYDQLGEKAKLRNAKVSYYTGSFGYAKGQLDVLKGSTSKLISNDAMDLSLLITDNSTVDTTTVPLKIYARADLLNIQNKDSLALLALDSIEALFPAHALADEVHYQKYLIAYKRKEFDTCITELETIIDTYSYDILADDALFKLAELYEVVLNDKEKALELYEKLLLEFSGSLYTVEARKRFRLLRGDNI